MAIRSTIAMDLGRHRLRALSAEPNGRTIVVTHALVKNVPSGLDVDDPDAVGRWVGAALREAGFPRGRTTIALAREHVSLKRLTLPTIDPDELPEMTRLALRRELTFDPDTAVIDFTTLEQSEHQTSVIAVAVPRVVVDYVRRVAKSAGYPTDRISLRCMGTSTLLGSVCESDGNTLVIDATGDGIEFNVVSDGAVVFSRAAENPTPDDPDSAAESIVTETRRTWMSYRIAQDSQNVSSAVVLGDREVTEQVVDPLAEMLHIGASPFDVHPLVETDGQAMDAVWPLAGLLLEPLLKRRSIDFTHPRKAPDRAAHRRQRIMMAGIVLVALIAAVWTIGSVRLDRLRDELAGVRAQRSKLGPQYMQLNRDQYTLRHLDAWSSVDVDWLDHTRYLTTIAPPPGRVVLDGITGSLTFRGVEYDAKTTTKGADERWSAPREMTIVLDGEAVDRPTADDLRAALVDANLYRTSSTGSDAANGRRLPFGFTYRLLTNRDMPENPAPSEEPTTATAMREEGER